MSLHAAAEEMFHILHSLFAAAGYLVCHPAHFPLILRHQAGSGGNSPQHHAHGKPGHFSFTHLKKPPFFGIGIVFPTPIVVMRLFLQEKLCYNTMKRELQGAVHMQAIQNAPKTVLCIHDLSSVGRAGLSVIIPTLSAMGVQPIALPTAVLSSHTGGLGDPVVLGGGGYGRAALDHFANLGIRFDVIYSGYLGNANQVELVEKAISLWPHALKVVDPVLGDGGRLYSGIYPSLVEAVRGLCRKADIILPNLTEAGFLLGEDVGTPETRAEASILACKLKELAPNVVITGLPMGKMVGCAGAGQEDFIIQKPLLPRSYPGTGDIFASALIGGLCRGNVLSAATDHAAAFVGRCIEVTPPEADRRYGVHLESALPELMKLAN